MGAGLRHVQGEWAGTAWPVHASDWRNGKSAKTVRTGDGPVRLAIPRDRDGSFEPILIPKHERRFTGFDDKIIAMYARGMTVREIQGFLAEQYGTEVRSEEHTSELQSLMRISYAVFCLKKKQQPSMITTTSQTTTQHNKIHITT